MRENIKINIILRIQTKYNNITYQIVILLYVYNSTQILH